MENKSNIMFNAQLTHPWGFSGRDVDGRRGLHHGGDGGGGVGHADTKGEAACGDRDCSKHLKLCNCQWVCFIFYK